MLLSGAEIREAVQSGSLVIDSVDFSSGVLQPASVDLTLDSILKIQSADPITGIKVQPETVDLQGLLDTYTESVAPKDPPISGRQSWELKPQQFVIGRTAETVGLPFDLAGRVEGRSRLARLGVGVHITAPKIDPGFTNRITLEIFNLGHGSVDRRTYQWHAYMHLPRRDLAASSRIRLCGHIPGSLTHPGPSRRCQRSRILLSFA